MLYNRLAEIAGEYLKKGRAVYVEGRFITRKRQQPRPAAPAAGLATNLADMDDDIPF